MSYQAAIPSVLLVRLSAIGDIVMASGLPANIKDHFNGKVRIIWLVESDYVELISHHPDVDEVIPWPKRQWRTFLTAGKLFSLGKALWQFKKRLRQTQCSLAIDAQGLLKSALLCWLSGAPRRLGFTSKEYSHWLLNDAILRPQSPMISSEYRLLAKTLSTLPYQLSMHIPTQHSQAAVSTLKQLGISADYIALAPFTTRPQKHWHPPHWHDLIERLAQLGHRVVILGGPADQEAAQALTNGHPNCVSTAGKLSLLESAAAVARSQLFIGVDTGLTHMAMALQRPSIALFGSTRPYTQTDNPHARVLFSDFDCAPCKRKPSCQGRFDCMQQLSPAQVLITAKSLLPA